MRERLRKPRSPYQQCIESIELGRVLINAQIAGGEGALTSRLRYPAIAIIMEHSDVLFDIHNAKNDA
jgi:hypothetical protein